MSDQTTIISHVYVLPIVKNGKALPKNIKVPEHLKPWRFRGALSFGNNNNEQQQQAVAISSIQNKTTK